MPQADTDTCGWRGCENDASSEVHLDAGSAKCSECGAEKTDRRTFKLCDEHGDQFTASGDSTMLLLSAQEA